MTLFTFKLDAQYCGKQTYSFKDGLNQPYTYSKVDSKGRLWVDSRGGGINMFDGKKWKNFTQNDGLLYTWGTPFFEDKKGGIWITHSYQKGVSRYLNNEFTKYSMSAKNVDSTDQQERIFPFIKDIPYFRYNAIKDELISWNRDSTQQLWMYPFDFETNDFANKGIPFFSDAQLKKSSLYLKKAKTWLYLINDYNGEYQIVYFHQNGTLQSMDRNGNIKSILDQTLTTPSTIHNAIFQNKDGSFSGSYVKNGAAFIKSGHTIKKIPKPKLKPYGTKNDELKLTFHKWAIHHYYITQDANKTIIGIWKVERLGFENSFVLAEYDTRSFDIVNTVFFSEDKTIGVVTKDNAGTYWYCNGSTQVRLFPNQHWIPTGFQGMPAEAWSVGQTINRKMWFGSYRKELVNYDGTFIQPAKNKTLLDQIYMDGSESDEKGNVYFTTLNGIVKFDSNENHSFLAEKKLGFYLNRNNNGELLFGSQQEGLWILPNNKTGKLHSDWNKIDQSKGLKLLNVITALEDNQGRYWMGRGSQGMAIYFPEQDTVYNWIKEANPAHLGVQSMDVDKYGNIWLGTDKGLYFFNQDKHELSANFDFHQNLEPVGSDYTGNSIVQVCKIYNDSTLVAGNGLGYFLINLNDWYANPRQLNITSITDETGHLAGGVIQNGICIDHRKDIWLMCANGAVRYTPNKYKKDGEQIPNVVIDQVFVGETEVNNISEPLKVGSEERNITINFHVDANTNVIGNFNYRYRLNPADDWSKLISTDYVNFYNLSVGEYHFEVIAERNGIQSSPAKYKFEIDKSLFQKPWIYLTACILIFGFGVNYSLREQKLKSKQNAINTITKEKDALQIQTIVNQLNPHFINNALQWLQIRLDRNEDKEGVSVVGKLSENISTVFKNSRTQKAFHSLENELQLTENYLYIQKIRFKEKLNYEIPNVEDMRHLKMVHIPLLMLQIHIENAVEHGLRNKSVGGTVTVTCDDDDRYVYLHIIDDGVGRKKAKKIGSHGTQNGLAMLEELLAIYNKQNTYKLTQEFFDDIYTTEQGVSFGTKVIIKIPKNYNYTI